MPRIGVFFRNVLLNEKDTTYGVIISNSGSKYKPYNICFMKLFYELQRLR